MRNKISRLVFIVLLSISPSILLYGGIWKYGKEKPKKENRYDFRKTRWGMTKAQVKRREKAKSIESGDENLLYYKGNIIGLDCRIFYFFDEGKLIRAGYHITDSTVLHPDLNDYVADYNRLKEILKKKYGKPIEDTLMWLMDSYKDKYKNNLGLAVSLGYLNYFTTWETFNKTISLALIGMDYGIDIGIEYKSKRLKEKSKKKVDLEKF